MIDRIAAPAGRDVAEERASELVDRIWRMAVEAAAHADGPERVAARELVQAHVIVALRSMQDGDIRGELEDVQVELSELRAEMDAFRDDAGQAARESAGLTAARVALQQVRRRVVRPAGELGRPLDRKVVEHIADIVIRGLRDSERPGGRGDADEALFMGRVAGEA